MSLRKTFKRSAINDVGFIASATRGSAVMLDKTFNAALFMNGMNQTMIGLVDDWAGQFGGYTKHSVGDKMFAWTLKGATILEKATVNGITKIADYSEKKLKKEIMYARLRSRTRA